MGSFIKWLGTLFQGPNGDMSSKRLFGLACGVVAIVMAFTGGAVESQGLWLGTAAVVFGVQAFSKT